jgi:hypothetical protein
VVVAGNLLIPAVSTQGGARNAIREYRYHQPAKVKVTLYYFFIVV